MDQIIRDPNGLTVIEALAPQVSRYAEAMGDGIYSPYSSLNSLPEDYVYPDHC